MGACTIAGVNAQSEQPGFAGVLTFWFGAPSSPDLGRPRAEWFRKDPAFDETIRSQFGELHVDALAGKLDEWSATPYACLALVIVLDQFPRNLFRNDARAFAADAKALHVARTAVERGFDKLLRPVERTFLYLPFEHAEDLPAQHRSLQLFESLRESPGGESLVEYAHRHFEIIARFGRFPHRNAALKRTSTAEEIEFLQRPGSGF